MLGKDEPSERVPRCPAGEGEAFLPTMRAMLAAAMLLGSAFAADAADCRASAEPSRDWSGCNRRNLMLSEANLEKADLHGADISLSDLRDATLAAANLEDAKLAGTSLAGALADGANFTKVEGYRTDFSKTSAKGASFRGAELQRSNFTGAALLGSNFEKAELGRANFDAAGLGDNVFTFANLARANLKNAKFEGPLDLTGAYMFLTRIEGADLSAATGLAQAQIDLACGDSETKLPAGLNHSTSWPCRSD